MDTPQSDASARFNGASLLYRLLDAGIVIACGLAATELKFAEDMTGDPPPIHLFLIYLCGLGVVAVFPAFRLYQSWRGRRLADLAARCVAAWATVFALGILISFLMHQAAALSRMWPAPGSRWPRSRWSARASAPMPSWARRAIAA